MRKSWSSLSCAVALLAVGCGSGANSDFYDAPGSGVRIRPVGPASMTGVGLGPLAPPTSTPPGDPADTSGLAGHWYIDKDGARFDLAIQSNAGQLTGTMGPEGGVDAGIPIEHAVWEPATGQLRFRVQEEDLSLWYAVAVTDGVMAGRYATVVGSRVGPASWSAYSGHLVGWRDESFSQDLAPRVFDLVVDDGRLARLRLDRGTAAGIEFVGEFKTKATTAMGSDGELPAQAIVVRHWDGQQLVFDMNNGTTRQRFTATASGRTLAGSMVDGTAAPVRWVGTRANILSYGLRNKTEASRRDWQERSRRILYQLMMAGNPAPMSTETTVTDRDVVKMDENPASRDDDSVHWLQQYRLSDVVLEHAIPNPYGADPLSRRMHGILAVPTTTPPADGFPIVVSLNGHIGSAQRQFQPDDYYWYGDAYARRGYAVLAIDISHRPPSESGGLYGDPEDGDSPDTGNHAHPAIAAPGLDSDWADDGERAWDAMRGVDFMLAQPNVNRARIIVTGLSMGAEMTEVVGALDPRVTTIVMASAPPDLSLMGLHGNHPCWRWTHGDITEFVEMSDYLAMTAPRAAIVESGKWDYTYSSYSSPYAVEKENAWRARIAYGDEAANLVHYLHASGHQYRIGDISNESPDPDYIQVPQVIAPPGVRWRSVDWEVDGQTVSLDQTLFDYLAR